MLARNIGKHYIIKEGEWFLAFEIWHNYVLDILYTDSTDYAWHFKTVEDAHAFIKTISYPRFITDYQIVRCD